jgi:hypothetical protein
MPSCRLWCILADSGAFWWVVVSSGGSGGFWCVLDDSGGFWCALMCLEDTDKNFKVQVKFL